jgi:hypothetical protein
LTSLTDHTPHTSVNGDSITTPDVLRVDIGEANVLNDNVLCVAHDAHTLALNDTLVALADQRLVGANGHAEHTGFVVGDLADLGCAGLVVVTPLVLVDGELALRASSPWSTTRIGDGSLRSGEVKGLGQNDNAGRRVRKVVLELSDGRWVDRGGTASSSDT